MNRIVLPTAEEEKRYGIGMISDYSRTYIEVYRNIVVGFYLRMGDVPSLVWQIGCVWSRGVAECQERIR